MYPFVVESNHVVRLTIEVSRGESGFWLAGSPELDVYSQGETPDDARANAIEALTLFLDSVAEKGTLLEVLQQSKIRVLEISALDRPDTPPAAPGPLGRFASFFRRTTPEVKFFPIPEHALAHS